MKLIKYDRLKNNSNGSSTIINNNNTSNNESGSNPPSRADGDNRTIGDSQIQVKILMVQ